MNRLLENNPGYICAATNKVQDCKYSSHRNKSGQKAANWKKF